MTSKKVLKDLARRYAQGIIENAEALWAFEDLSEDELLVMQNELQKIAKRIGATRDFSSRQEQD